MIYKWTAKNNNSFLIGFRSAKTLRGAITEARRYVDSELYGEGTIYIHECEKDQLSWFEKEHPIRVDEKNLFTNYKWKTVL